MVSLKNTSRGPIQINLPHDQYCGKDGANCHCQKIEQTQAHTDRASGEAGIRTIERRLSATLYLMPGETRQFEDSVTNVADVSAALNRGELRKAGTQQAPLPQDQQNPQQTQPQVQLPPTDNPDGNH
jgi:hypothetical protein